MSKALNKYITELDYAENTEKHWKCLFFQVQAVVFLFFHSLLLLVHLLG